MWNGKTQHMFVKYVLPWVITQMNFLTKNICFNFQANLEKIKRNYRSWWAHRQRKVGEYVGL